MESQKSKRIAIVSVNSNVYSETFIRAHVELIEGEKFFLYGGYKPLYYKGESLVLLVPLFKRFIIKHLLRKNLLDYSIGDFLKKKKIEVILAEYGPTGCAVMEIAERLNIPLVVHFHGYDASSINLITEYKEQYKKLFGYAFRIIAVSNQMKENLIKMGAPKSKIIYAPCGPDLIFSDVSPNYTDSNSVLFAGRFVDKKAPWILIEVMRRILQTGINIKLVMVGDGVLLSTCKGLVKINGLGNSIDFHGAVSHQKVKELMGNSFCYIQHSVTTADGETEGTPVSIQEASQAGLAVISTRHAGISDVVIHGETGFLVDEFDVESMTQYLLFLHNNRQLAREMGMKGKIWIRENFSLVKHISILNNALDDAIGRC